MVHGSLINLNITNQYQLWVVVYQLLLIDVDISWYDFPFRPFGRTMDSLWVRIDSSHQGHAVVLLDWKRIGRQIWAWINQYKPVLVTYFWPSDRIPINISDLAYFLLFLFRCLFLSKCFLCLVFIISLLFVLDDEGEVWRFSRFSWRIWRFSSRLEELLEEPEDEPDVFSLSFSASTFSIPQAQLP